MRNPFLVACLLAPLASSCTTSRPQPHPQSPLQRQWTAYGQPQAQQARPSYALPWAVPAPPHPGTHGAAPAAAPAASVGASPGQAPPRPWGAARDTCLADTGSRADCEAALGSAAQAWSATPGAPRDPAVHDVYRRACERKAKLQGCGVFKSTAVDSGDRANVELLMLCEAGRSEACEDVATKKAPLVAWHSTLEAAGCKKGQSALCKSHKQCRPGAQWGCSPASASPGTGDVCGCVPRKCDGAMTVTASPRKWPDGSARGDFTCAAR